MFLCVSRRLGGSLGELNHAIVVEQFSRLRQGDSWWYERSGVLDRSTLQEIQSTLFVSAAEGSRGTRPQTFLPRTGIEFSLVPCPCSAVPLAGRWTWRSATPTSRTCRTTFSSSRPPWGVRRGRAGGCVRHGSSATLCGMLVFRLRGAFFVWTDLVNAAVVVVDDPSSSLFFHELPGVVFNDLNGDGRRTNVVGGTANEPGIAGVRIGVYVASCNLPIILQTHSAHCPPLPPPSHSSWPIRALCGVLTATGLRSWWRTVSPSPPSRWGLASQMPRGCT